MPYTASYCEVLYYFCMLSSMSSVSKVVNYIDNIIMWHEANFLYRFVENALDDYEGQLSRDGTTNFHGVIKFEIARVYTLDTNKPLTGWELVDPLAETYTFRDKLADGK